MKLKLDENLGNRGAEVLRAEGHDVATVPGQHLCAASDRDLMAVCAAEGRCLITLDLDFGNPLLFPPERYAGVAVLRLPHKPTADDLWACCRTLLAGLAREDLTGKLWIVEPHRIREYQPELPEDEDE